MWNRFYNYLKISECKVDYLFHDWIRLFFLVIGFPFFYQIFVSITTFFLNIALFLKNRLWCFLQVLLNNNDILDSRNYVGCYS